MKNELVSADEAVARLLNIDFIPSAYSLEHLLDGFVDEANARFEAAVGDRGQSIPIMAHMHAVHICELRVEMATYLLMSLRIQAENDLLIAKDSTSRTQMFNWEAVQEWALENFGIVVPDSVVIVESTSPTIPASTTTEPAEDNSTKSLDKLVGGGLSKTKSKNLLVTLYALAKTHADRHQSALIKKPTDTLVIDAVAKEIVEMVSKLSGEQTITGQSSEAIKDRLEAAEEAWKLVV